MILEGTKKVEDVHNNRPPSKQVDHVVVNEVVNHDELVKDANCIFLKERLAKDVEGDESTSNSYLEKYICFTTR